MWKSALGVTLSLLFTACAGDPEPPLITGSTEQAIWSNGDFENDAIGTTPPSGWTQGTNLHQGITDTRPSPQTLASLNLVAGGVAMTSVVGGAPETQIDPDIGASGTLRFPKYGTRAARINYGSPSANGSNQNVNSLKQQMVVSLGDVDPTDNQVHVRFAIAPVLENPGHAYNQQPYYFVRLQNLTTGTTLYQDFNASGQPGVPWKNFTDASYQAAQYTDWQLVDIAPGDSRIAVGDSVELLVIAAGCQAGGHWGRVYVDAVGSGIPGLYSWATGPQQSNAGTDITYTVNYKNGGTTTTTGTSLDLVTPPNTVYKSTSGAGCTAPAVGATGTLSCPLGSLSPGATGAFAVTVTVPAGTATGSLVTNGNYSIYATGVSALVGPKVYTTVTNGASYADVSITKTDGVAAIGWGQATTYTIVASNAGPLATTATITDAMPNKLAGVAWTCVATGGGTCTASGLGSISQAVSLPVGATLTYTVNATVIAGTGSSSMVNTATIAVTGGLTDPDTSHNVAVDTDTIGTLRTLTVTKQGLGSAGSLNSTPAAISCGTGCSTASADFLDGSQVVLAAAPITGATFVGWGGACTGSSTTCTVTMAGARAVTATFAGAPATTVASSGATQQTTVSTAFTTPLAVLVSDAGGNPVPGVTVTFAGPGSGARATLSASTAVTNASGIAQVTATANATAGSYAVTGTITGITPVASFALANVGLPATILVSAGSGQSATVGTAFATSLTALVRDSSSQPVANVTVTFTAPGSGARAVLSSATATTNASGLASITATANTIAGAYAVTASVSGVGTAASFALSNTAGAATLITVTAGATQSTIVTTAFAAPLAAKATDTYGNAVAGVAITFTPPATGASASLSAAAVTTAANGIAQTTATASPIAGTYAVSATATGLAPIAFALTNTPGAATALSIAGGATQSTTVHTAFALPLAVRVSDAHGNAVPGTTVTFAAPSSGASATVSAATTDGAGMGSTTAVASTIAGSYVVTASIAGGPAVSFGLANLADAPATVTITSGGGQTATVGAAFAQPIQVGVVDQYSNPVAAATVTLTGPATGASLAPNIITLTTNAAGTAAQAVTANHTTGTYAVTAAVPGVALAPSIALTNRAGAATTLAVVGGAGQHATVAAAFASPLVVVATDTYANLVPGATITFSTPSSGPTGTVTTTVSPTGPDGRATTAITAGTVAGAYSVTASLPGTSTTFALTNDAGAPATIAITAGSGQHTTVATAFPTALAAHVTDTYGNDVPSATVMFAAPATDARAVLSSTTATTDASGLASITATAGTIAGAYAVTASVSGVATAASFALSNTADAATLIAVTAGATQSTVVTTAFAAPLAAKATDTYGNAVAGVAITFTPPATGASASLSAAAVTTAANGIAQTTATASPIAGTYVVAATATGLAPIAFALTNTPGAATALSIAGGATQSTTVHTAFALPLSVLVSDAHGNAVPGTTVTFAAPSSGASATVSAATTDGAGLGATTAVASTVAGSYVITASIAGGPAISFGLTNTADAPATVTITSGGGQTASVAAAFAQALEVSVVDQYGNSAADATVTLTGPATGASISPNVLTLTTNAAGTAAQPVTANHTTGTYAVTAAVPGVALAPSIALTNRAGAATTLAVVSGAGQHATVAAAFASPLIVVATDTYANLVPDAAVTFSTPSSGPTATVATATAPTGSDGRATTAITAGTVAGAYSITASIPGTSTTFALTNDAGAPATIATTAGSGQHTTVATAFPTALATHVTDTYGNDVPSATVTFAAPVTGARAVLSSTTAITTASGLASISATAGETAGPYDVTATVTGAPAVRFALTNTAGIPAHLTVTGGNAQSAVILTAFAAPLALHASDAYDNAVPNAAITYSVVDPGITASLPTGGQASTDADGDAQIVATAGTRAGGYQVTAQSGEESISFHLTNLPGTAAGIAIVDGDAQQSTVAQAFTAPLRVRVTDEQGNPVPAAQVTFTSAPTLATAVLSAPSVATDANGIASISAVASETAGEHAVTASISSGATIAFQLTNTPDAPASITVAASASPQLMTVGELFAAPLVLTIRDRFGNLVPNAVVTFSAPTSGPTASLATTMVTTDENGEVSTVATAGTIAGAYIIHATVAGIPDAAAISLTNTAGAPATLLVHAGDEQATMVDTDLAIALAVQVLDANDNPVPGVVVRFDAPVAAATATLVASAAQTDTNGVAVMPAHASTKTGAYEVTAALSGATAPVSFQLANTAGAPTSIVASSTSTPQNAQVDHPFQRALVTHVVDSFGNDVPGVVVSYTAPATPATATLSAATALTGSDGRSSVLATASPIAGTYRVLATAPGVAMPAQFALGNLPGPVVMLTISAGSNQSATVTTTFASPLVVLVEDEYGNAVPDTMIEFLAPTTGALVTIASTSVATDATGHAATELTAGTQAGDLEVTAVTVSGVAPVAFTLTTTAGAPASATTAVSSSPQSAEILHGFARPLALTVVDAYGNRVPGALVAFTAPSMPGAQLSAATATTDGEGVASVLAIADEIAGSYAVSAAIEGTTGAAFSLANLPSAPSYVVVATGGGQETLATSAFAEAIVLRTADSYGNPVPGVQLALSIHSAGATATLSNAAPVTDASGVATVTLTAGPTLGTFTLAAAAPGALTAGTSTFSVRAIPTTTIATMASELSIDETVPVTITVSSELGEPVGTIEIVDADGTVRGTAALAAGTATITLGGLTMGTHTLSARYAAQGSFAASSSMPVTVEVTSDAGTLSGGGCNVGNNGSGSLVGALLLGLALVARRRRQLIAGALVLASAGIASADPEGSRAIDRHEAAAADSEWFSLDSATFTGHRDVTVSLVGDFAKHPLTTYDADGSVRDHVVTDQLVMHLAASVTLGARARLSASVPMSPWQNGDGGTYNGMTLAAPEFAFGDVSLAADARVFGDAHSPVRMLAGVRFGLPTGSRSNFMSDGLVGVEPRVMLGGSFRGFEYAGSASAYLRERSDMAGAQFGSELRYAVAAGVRLASGRLLVGPELVGAAPLVADTDVGTPLEAQLGAHYTASRHFRVGVGGAAGITNAIGVPAWRMLASLTWNP